MKIKGDKKSSSGRRRNREILAAAILIPFLLALILGAFWTYYYDLNDDALMKQILSGEFTGTPEIRNIQSLFPLTAVLGGLYHVFHRTDVYGIFLLILQFGCLGIIIVRAGRLVTGDESGCLQREAQESEKTETVAGRTSSGRRQRALFCSCRAQLIWDSLGAAVLFLAFSLYHLVFLQYSFTVGVLGSTAAFLFLTMRLRKEGGVEVWIRELLPPILLIWLGFLLRSEMMMFMAPLIGLSFLFRLFDLNSRAAEKAKIFLLTVVLVCAGVGAGWAGDRAGYASPEWQEFRAFFDARTQLYDFELIPSYEENQAFYDSIGLDPSEVALIQNYNFGIDDRIDAETIQRIADYAEDREMSVNPPSLRLRNALWDLRHSWSNADNKPYLPAIAVFSVLVLAAVLSNWAGGGEKAWKRAALHLLELFLTLGASCGMLLYLYYNQRPVVRLTHSIYLAEAVMLVWMLARETFSADCCGQVSAESGEDTVSVWREKKKSDKNTLDGKHGRKEYGRAAAGVLVSITALAACVMQIRQVHAEQAERIQKNGAYVNEFLPYAAGHPGNVYYTDVYSTVDFSDRVFGKQTVPVNWDLMGGWASKSPLEFSKLQRLGCAAAAQNDVDADSAGISTSLIMQESLLSLDNCFVAAEAGEDMQWLVNYYAFRGTEVTMVEADRIGNGDSGWVIWKVQKVQS